MVFVTFKELVEYVVEASKDLALFATIAWIVWHRRNALQISSALFPIQQVHQVAMSYRTGYVHSLPPKPLDQSTTTSQRPI